MRIERLPDADSLYIDLAERAGVDARDRCQRPARVNVTSRRPCHP